MASRCETDESEIVDKKQEDEDDDEEVEYVCLALSSQDTLNSMFDSIKDFTQEVKIKFTGGGMEIISQDTTGVVVVLLNITTGNILRSGGFYEYKTSVPCVEACVNVKLMSTIFKSAISQGDIVELRILASEPNFINVIERNINTLKCTSSKIKVIKPEATPNVDYVKSIKYDNCVSMESVEFYDIIKKLCITESNSVRFWCDGKVISMSAAGQFASTELSLVLENVCSPDCLTPKNCDKERTHDQHLPPVERVYTVDPMDSFNLEKRCRAVKRGTALFCTRSQERMQVDEIYPLAFIQRISKSKSVSKIISILTTDDHRIITLSYDTEIGSLRFVVAYKQKSKDEPETDRPVSCNPDKISTRVDEACKERCNSMKRKRTRRVWSRKDQQTPSQTKTKDVDGVNGNADDGTKTSRKTAKRRKTPANPGTDAERKADEDFATQNETGRRGRQKKPPTTTTTNTITDATITSTTTTTTNIVTDESSPSTQTGTIPEAPVSVKEERATVPEPPPKKRQCRSGGKRKQTSKDQVLNLSEPTSTRSRRKPSTIKTENREKNQNEQQLLSAQIERGAATSTHDSDNDAAPSTINIVGEMSANTQPTTHTTSSSDQNTQTREPTTTDPDTTTIGDSTQADGAGQLERIMALLESELSSVLNNTTADK